MVISPEIKDDAIKTKGYFIYLSQLFINVAESANTNDSLNTPACFRPAGARVMLAAVDGIKITEAVAKSILAM